jgi:hypothetical protein
MLILEQMVQKRKTPKEEAGKIECTNFPREPFPAIVHQHLTKKPGQSQLNEWRWWTEWDVKKIIIFSRRSLQIIVWKNPTSFTPQSTKMGNSHPVFAAPVRTPDCSRLEVQAANLHLWLETLHGSAICTTLFGNWASRCVWQLE